MPEHFSPEELQIVAECFHGRAAWIEKHYGYAGGRMIADNIRALGKKVLRALRENE